MSNSVLDEIPTVRLVLNDCCRCFVRRIQGGTCQYFIPSSPPILFFLLSTSYLYPSAGAACWMFCGCNDWQLPLNNIEESSWEIERPLLKTQVVLWEREENKMISFFRCTPKVIWGQFFDCAATAALQSGPLRNNANRLRNLRLPHYHYVLLLVIVRTKPFEDDPYMWCVGIYFWCPIVVVGTTFDPPNITSLFVTLCDTIVKNAATQKSPLFGIMKVLKL